MRNIFPEKSYIKCGEETSPIIKHISGSTICNFAQLAFIVCPVEDYQNIVQLRC